MRKAQERIRLLDILRGFAILGTLGTNIWIFAYLGDISYVFTIEHAEWWFSIEDFLRMFVLFLVNGKFLGLLTIMFGVGLELKYQQSLRKGTAWPGIYVWTLFILLIEGFIHYTLVFEYDVLMSYAVTAVIVSLIVKGGNKVIKRAMKIVGGFHVIFILFILGISVLSVLTGGNISLGSMDDTVSLYKSGSWTEQIHHRLTNFWILRSEAIFIIPMNILLFLTGVCLMRSGAFSPDARGRKIRNKMLRIGLGLGVPLNLLIFIPGGVFDLPIRYCFAPILSIGYIALIARIVERNESYWLWSRLQAIGMMALSCYVFQNILSSIIFYGWGLDAGGNLNSLTIILIWITISIIQIGFAALWLRKFHLGPMESARKYFTRVAAGKN